MAKLKVFSGSSCEWEYRLIVGAYSRVDVVRQLKALGCRNASDYHIKGWWSLTHNELELRIATEHGVWRALVEWPKTIKDFERIA